MTTPSSSLRTLTLTTTTRDFRFYASRRPIDACGGARVPNWCAAMSQCVDVVDRSRCGAGVVAERAVELVALAAADGRSRRASAGLDVVLLFVFFDLLLQLRARALRLVRVEGALGLCAMPTTRKKRRVVELAAVEAALAAARSAGVVRRRKPRRDVDLDRLLTVDLTNDDDDVEGGVGRRVEIVADAPSSSTTATKKKHKKRKKQHQK